MSAFAVPKSADSSEGAAAPVTVKSTSNMATTDDSNKNYMRSYYKG